MFHYLGKLSFYAYNGPNTYIPGKKNLQQEQNQHLKKQNMSSFTLILKLLIRKMQKVDN